MSYGWNHILVKDGNNLEEIDNAITKAKQQNGPTLIEVKQLLVTARQTLAVQMVFTERHLVLMKENLHLKHMD